jgi:hypothetical protein
VSTDVAHGKVNVCCISGVNGGEVRFVVFLGLWRRVDSSVGVSTNIAVAIFRANLGTAILAETLVNL